MWMTEVTSDSNLEVDRPVAHGDQGQGQVDQGGEGATAQVRAIDADYLTVCR